MNDTYWLDKWEGTAGGGYFLRSTLKDFFEKLKKQGIKPVGIKYDGSYNLEIIVELKPKENANEA